MKGKMNDECLNEGMEEKENTPLGPIICHYHSILMKC